MFAKIVGYLTVMAISIFGIAIAPEETGLIVLFALVGLVIVSNSD